MTPNQDNCSYGFIILIYMVAFLVIWVCSCLVPFVKIPDGQEIPAYIWTILIHMGFSAGQVKKQFIPTSCIVNELVSFISIACTLMWKTLIVNFISNYVQWQCVFGFNWTTRYLSFQLRLKKGKTQLIFKEQIFMSNYFRSKSSDF